MPSALVTGTSTGIGKACVARLAERGWKVFAGVRRREDGERLQAEHHNGVHPVILDVSNREHIHRVIDDITGEVGERGLQGLVNNAGVGVGGPIEYLREDDWRFVFDVNLFGVVALSQAATPLLRAGRGRIVHIGSIGGRISLPGLAPYNASKHAIEALAETMRNEFRLSGTPIRVALIEPGAVKTAIWDKGDTTVDEIEQRLDGVGQSRYRWLVDLARGFIDDGRRVGIPGSRVADAVEHALTADRPKLRYLVGPDAKLSGHIAARAPDRVRDAFIRMASKRYEWRGRKVRRKRAA